MSMEIYAILPSGVAIPTKHAWEAALADLHLDVVFHPDFVPDRTRGFCPMTIAGQTAGCEIDCNLETVEALCEDNPDLDGLAADGAVFSFRFGGTMLEGACAYAGAAGLIHGCGAVLYDPMVAALSRNPESAATTAKEFLTLAE